MDLIIVSLNFKIIQNVNPSNEFTLHYYLKAYDEFFGLLLKEKEIFTIKIERNIIVEH